MVKKKKNTSEPSFKYFYIAFNLLCNYFLPVNLFLLNTLNAKVLVAKMIIFFHEHKYNKYRDTLASNNFVFSQITVNVHLSFIKSEVDLKATIIFFIRLGTIFVLF